MPGAARLGDDSMCPVDAHGCTVCTHCVRGPAVQGSPDVFINGKPALRRGDQGIHKVCCGSNTWAASEGAPTVFINGRPAVRLHDRTVHCGGIGRMVEGSSDVIIGSSQSRLFLEARKKRAPFVENVSPMSSQFIQRAKPSACGDLQKRNTENYFKGDCDASFIDAIGESMIDDAPVASGGTAASVAIELAGRRRVGPNVINLREFYAGKNHRDRYRGRYRNRKQL